MGATNTRSFGRVVYKVATNSRHEFVSPIQGFYSLKFTQPRPLAWADLRDAFGVGLQNTFPGTSPPRPLAWAVDAGTSAAVPVAVAKQTKRVLRERLEPPIML
jgi:hypothetical protein